jgi:3-hydroxyacyl-[acyl-carrier-protein] dehydratase
MPLRPIEMQPTAPVTMAVSAETGSAAIPATEEAMEGKPAARETFDINRLYQLLPHRYPFLMVDRIVEVDADNSAVGIKVISANEPHFQGHFPGRPVMPGVLLVEGMAQTAGAICSATLPPDRRRLVYFMSIEQAKFRRPVFPGVTVEYHLQKLRHRGGVWKFAGEAKVDGQKVAEAVITAMVSE